MIKTHSVHSSNTSLLTVINRCNMAKLFALEDLDTSDNNELLIDKVLNYSKQEKSQMSLTADILAQRNELKEQINKELNKEPEDDQNPNASSTDDNDNPSSKDDTEDPDESKDNTDENKEPTPEEKTEGNKNPEENSDDVGDDKDSIKSVIGSGLNNADNKKDDNTEDDKKDKPSTESFRSKIGLNDVFKPIKNSYSVYAASLSKYNLSTEQLSIKEQPVVYVKDSVIKSLEKLIEMANGYINNNLITTEKFTVSVKNYNEKITIFRQFVSQEKFHFTNKLINDRDILGNLLCPLKSDLIETSRILLNYVEDSTKSNTLLVNNDFSEIVSAYASKNFIVDGDDLMYKTVLPGFNIVRVHVENYKDYIKTDIENYQYYKIKTLKTEDLYSLNSITITEDKELNRLLDMMDKLLVNVSLTTDNLKDINTHFTKFIDEVKVIIFDINNDKYKDLASIDIDSKVKDFIKFKLAIESSYININTISDYLTTMLSVLNICVNLKD